MKTKIYDLKICNLRIELYQKYAVVELDFDGKPYKFKKGIAEEILKFWEGYFNLISNKIGKNKTLYCSYGDCLIRAHILKEDLKMWVRFLLSYAFFERNLELKKYYFWRFY